VRALPTATPAPDTIALRPTAEAIALRDHGWPTQRRLPTARAAFEVTYAEDEVEVRDEH
jgi:hypothetical protein